MGGDRRACVIIVCAVGLVQTACTTVEGADDGIRVPGGDDSGDRGDASPVNRDDGTEDGCDLASGVSGGGTIRLVYLVPSDRDPDPRYTANLEQSLRHVQLWLRDRIPQRTSFLVHEPSVDVVRSSHPASYFASNVVGTDPNYYYWYNATADALDAVGGSFGDLDDVWLIYVAADAGCGQYTGTSSHVALFPENDLRGLVGDPRVPTCPGGEDSYGRCRWVGGMALLLSFALGVPDAAACADDDPGTACDNDLLFRLGYTTYPDATLGPNQLDFLTASTFLRGAGLPDCDLSCDDPVAP